MIERNVWLFLVSLPAFLRPLVIPSRVPRGIVYCRGQLFM